MKFRKTALVEAVQWFQMGDHPAVVPVPYGHPTSMHAIKSGEWGWCPTLEGGHLVQPGDWILTGVQGEHWPCKADIFASTYEPASRSETSEADLTALRASIAKTVADETAAIKSEMFAALNASAALRASSAALVEKFEQRIVAPIQAKLAIEPENCPCQYCRSLRSHLRLLDDVRALLPVSDGKK